MYITRMSAYLKENAWPLLLASAVIRLGAAVIPLFNYLVPVFYLILGGWALAPSNRAAFGVAAPRGAGRCAAALFLLAAVYLLTSALVYLLFGTSPDNWNISFYNLMIDAGGGSTFSYFIVLSSVILLVYAVEEVYFRGILYSQLKNRFSPFVSIVLIAGLWAVFHLGVYGLRPFNPVLIAGMIPSVFLMGVVLGLIRIWTGSVLICIACQGLSNIVLLFWCTQFLT